jgi:acetylglutamate synthase
LGATEIKELIQANITRYSQKECAELTIKLHNQLIQLPRTLPVTIPDPTVVINKVNLMAMEHNACLDILDQLVPNSMWGTSKHMALLTEMGINSVIVSKRNSIHVPFKLHHFRGTSEETALLDTRATESFIDVGTVKRLKLGA